MYQPYQVPQWLRTDWDRLSAEEIRELQNRKLRDFVRDQLYPHSPYYREMFDRLGLAPDDIQSTDDLVKIPFTSKADLAPTADDPDRPNRFVLMPGELKKWTEQDAKTRRRIYRELTAAERTDHEKMLWEYYPVHANHTTGRTAQPTPIWFTQRDLAAYTEGARRTATLVNRDRLGRAVSTYPFTVVSHQAFWLNPITALGLGFSVLHTGGGKIAGTQAILDMIERSKPSYLVAMPGYMYHLCRTALQQGRDFSSVTHVALGGEKLTVELKQKLTGNLVELGADPDDLSVLGSYGFTENKGGLSECQTPPGDFRSYGYHTRPDMEFFEVIDPVSGQRVGEGETGEIVYTALDTRGTAVIRYRTGDIAVGGIVSGPCPNCGRTVPRISYDIRRSSLVQEFHLSKVKGTLLDLNAFSPILNGHPLVQEWQLEIGKRNGDPFDVDEITLYVALAEQADQSTFTREIHERFHRELEVTPNRIVFRSLPALLEQIGMETELKEKRVIDLRALRA
ncbi:phenylacetate--CoA ligase family protein [Brevibacillus sp. B_LB10_24]|uniref:phenylacetate--CoA ligase family protein n=1 Tax=Brevibacillus sp. B_LB10_24 TaxID=3380645 RepID=UPI0038BB9E54